MLNYQSVKGPCPDISHQSLQDHAAACWWHFHPKKKESKIKLCPFGWISPNWAKYAKYIRNCQPVSGAFCSLPSGKPTVCYGKSQSLIGNYRPINKLNGPCSIAILNYQRVYDMPICPRRLSICWKIHGTHGTTLRNPERRDCWPSKKVAPHNWLMLPP